MTHIPVMLAEVLAALRPRPGGKYADGTVGAGAGHAAAILRASAPDGWLFACDKDADAVESAKQRLAEFAGRFEIRQANYADLAEWVPERSCDGVLIDAGLSSFQLGQADRGFSFQLEGPLDMRLNRSQALTAAELVNEASAEELARVLWEYGGERQARRVARAIVHERERKRIETTRQLAELIERVIPRRGKKTHPATKAFQGLRVAVNDELRSLEKGLEAGLKILKSSGRLAVLSFQLEEHKIVKSFGRARAQDYTPMGGVDVPEMRKPRAPELKLITRKSLKPSELEVARNPRSRSGQLRVMEKA